MTDIIIPESPPIEEMVRCTTDFYADGGYSPGSSAPGRPPLSGFGRGVARGSLVRATDPIVRRFPQFIEWLPQPVRVEDLPEHKEERMASKSQGNPKPQPQIFDHKPQPTIAAAVAQRRRSMSTQ
jgi:hypothetical protein